MLERMKKNPRNSRKFRNHGFSLVELAIVMVIVMTIAAMAIPAVLTMIRELRISGEARDLNGAIVLAKMRAAANFARARVYADFSAKTFRVEWQQSGATSWTPEGGDQPLATGVSFGYGSLSSPPLNTQGTLGQALCSGSTTTACITFNSRGIPITSTGAPTPNDAIYITDGRTVTGVTVSATGLTKIWRTEASAASWKQR
ncbi:MAG: prepilin-type N-terminal cleavage/methylation domain-containing protein [Acidobacteriia bacterium]|nr:prepilin-type N-terminal cleavage/methylation domain-containing protein [Terriglobia bacterium]